jgi:hypothetical protein
MKSRYLFEGIFYPIPLGHCNYRLFRALILRFLKNMDSFRTFRHLGKWVLFKSIMNTFKSVVSLLFSTIEFMIFIPQIGSWNSNGTISR